MFTKSFWKSAAERCVKTLAQTGIAIVAASSFDWFHADVKAIVSTAATAGVLSLLTSIASVNVGDKGTPSIVPGPVNASLLPPGAEVV